MTFNYLLISCLQDVLVGLVVGIVLVYEEILLYRHFRFINMVSWNTMNFICQLKSYLHNPYLQNEMPLICKRTRMCLIFDGML